MSKKILVIDDEHELLKMMKLRLEAKGYKVVTASNGVEGLSQWEAEKPDLIFLDIMMPEMDGYTFVQESKARVDLKKAPIVMLTAKAQMEDIFKVEGVKDYITKPFEDKKLIEIINKYLY